MVIHKNSLLTIGKETLNQCQNLATNPNEVKLQAQFFCGEQCQKSRKMTCVEERSSRASIDGLIPEVVFGKSDNYENHVE